MATRTEPRENPSHEGGSAQRTIGALWLDAVGRGGPEPAYLDEREGSWQEVGLDEAAARVEAMANGLLARGIRKGDAFALLATTSLEWALFDFALALVGAVSAGIYPNSSPGDVRYIVEHSESVGVLVENEEQRMKLEGTDSDHVLTFADLLALEAQGRAYATEHPTALAERTATIREDDLFTYIYTSGTTGPPKACLITHRNYYAMTATIDGLDDFIVAGDVMLLYLPLAHNFGRLMHLSGPYAGFTIAFLADPLRIAEALPQVRPTVLPSVPRVYEKVYAAVSAQFAAATGVKRRIVDFALATGRAVSELRREGRPLPRGLALRHRLADRLVYSRLRAALGGRVRYCVSGGAPLSAHLAHFFHAAGISFLEGYGPTETSAATTCNTPDAMRIGTVGRPGPGVDMRVALDGELLVRSPGVFAGYYQNEEATRDAIDADGWFHTGDLGEIDDDGYVKITGRKKEIIVTAGGKNVAPAVLEERLKSHRLVSQAMVVGDNRPFIGALVTLEPEELAAFAKERGLSGASGPGAVAQLAKEQAVLDELDKAVAHANDAVSKAESIRKIAVLDRDFDAEHDEITPTLKLKRKVVVDHFSEQIEGLYRK